MQALLRPVLFVALIFVMAGCSNPPAAEEDSAPADPAPAEDSGSPVDFGGADTADEPYPGAQPVDGRSPIDAYPEPEDADEEAGDASMDDASDESSDDAMDSGDESGDEAADEEAADEEASEGAAGAALAALPLDETYDSEDYGYSLDYPTGWFVDDSGPVVMLSSKDTSDQPGTGGVPADMTKIDIVLLEGFPLDIETRVSQIREELDAMEEEVRFDLVGGEAATWLRGEGGMAGDTGIVVTILDGQLFQLQAYGDPAPLRAIAETFRVEE